MQDDAYRVSKRLAGPILRNHVKHLYAFWDNGLNRELERKDGVFCITRQPWILAK